MALTASQVKSALVGRYSDKGGLILKVHSTGLKQWFVRVQVEGRRTERLIGKYPELTLAEARTKAADWKGLIKLGKDPRQKINTPTFDQLAQQTLKSLEPNWKNPKHSKQWASTLATYASPFIGSKRVDQIDAANILELLTPIWNTKRETARRVKQRISVVLDMAVVAGFRESNPVSSVSAALPKGGQRVRHMPSMPYSDIPRFLSKLRSSERVTSITKLAIEFAILTVGRSGEVRQARWNQIKGNVWTIPADSMKSAREHRVPLSTSALLILEKAHQLAHGDVVFYGRSGQVMSDMTLQQPLRRLDRRGFTMHGFRSSFRDWASEKTDADWAVIELCLAHSIGSQVERAYARSDLLERRSELLQSWADYLQLESN